MHLNMPADENSSRVQVTMNKQWDKLLIGAPKLEYEPRFEPVNGMVQPLFTPPACQRPRNTTQLKHLMDIVMPAIFEHRFAWPFKHPVNVIKLNLDDYFSIITHPMDLTTVRKRLEHNWYFSAKECIRDLWLIFYNCYRYNDPRQDVVHMAQSVEKDLLNKLKRLPKDEAILNITHFEETKAKKQKKSEPVSDQETDGPVKKLCPDEPDTKTWFPLTQNSTSGENYSQSQPESDSESCTSSSYSSSSSGSSSSGQSGASSSAKSVLQPKRENGQKEKKDKDKYKPKREAEYYSRPMTVDEKRQLIRDVDLLPGESTNRRKLFPDSDPEVGSVVRKKQAISWAEC